MIELQFNSEDEVIQHIHRLCLSGEIQKFHLFSIIRDNFYTLQEVDTSPIKDMFEFSYKKRQEGRILIFLKPLEKGFEFRFFTKSLSLEYILDQNGIVSYQSYDNYDCEASFPVDHKAVAESFELIKNHFLKKLQSS